MRSSVKARGSVGSRDGFVLFCYLRFVCILRWEMTEVLFVCLFLVFDMFCF